MNEMITSVEYYNIILAIYFISVYFVPAFGRAFVYAFSVSIRVQKSVMNVTNNIYLLNWITIIDSL